MTGPRPLLRGLGGARRGPSPTWSGAPSGSRSGSSAAASVTARRIAESAIWMDSTVAATAALRDGRPSRRRLTTAARALPLGLRVLRMSEQARSDAARRQSRRRPRRTCPPDAAGRAEQLGQIIVKTLDLAEAGLSLGHHRPLARGRGRPGGAERAARRRSRRPRCPDAPPAERARRSRTRRGSSSPTASRSHRADTFRCPSRSRTTRSSSPSVSICGWKGSSASSETRGSTRRLRRHARAEVDRADGLREVRPDRDAAGRACRPTSTAAR